MFISVFFGHQLFRNSTSNDLPSISKRAEDFLMFAEINV
jgi:hypothetical protein